MTVFSPILEAKPEIQPVIAAAPPVNYKFTPLLLDFMLIDEIILYLRRCIFF
jgi:hypothetical protein